MLDRELIELSARAIDRTLYLRYGRYYTHPQDDRNWWNPLRHARDAFELMVKLQITVQFWEDEVSKDRRVSCCVIPNERIALVITHRFDRMSATRRCLTLMAARIQLEKENRLCEFSNHPWA